MTYKRTTVQRPFAGDLRYPYTHRKWRRLRKLQLQRHPLCAFCLESGVIMPASVADHVTPHIRNAQPAPK